MGKIPYIGEQIIKKILKYIGEQIIKYIGEKIIIKNSRGADNKNI